MANSKLDAKTDVIDCVEAWMDPCPDPCQSGRQTSTSVISGLAPSIKNSRTYEYAGYHQDITK